MFNNHISWTASASASDRNIPAYGSFNIWWRNVTKKKLSANLYSNRKIRLVRVFSVGLLNDYVRGNQFGEVVQDHSGKYLLGNVLHLFCMKMKQTYSIFQFSKGSFNTPTHPIEMFQFFGREAFFIQVCNHCFISRIRQFEPNNPKWQIIKSDRIVLMRTGRQIIKRS